MKTISLRPIFPVCLILLATLVLASSRVGAAIPEPDNVLYGSISLDGVPVTAARTDVVIEARRTLHGSAIARYRMGASAALGHLYALRLALESVAPASDPDASQLGDTVFIVVTDGSGLRAETSYTILERGVAQRVDFGVAAVDSDGNGLPDAWELLYFTHIGQPANTVNTNGQTLWQNFVAGTNPNDTNSVLRLNITQSGAQPLVSFLARAASGTGYEGRSRFYALETRTNLAVANWTTLPGQTALPGNDQIISVPVPGVTSLEYFRVRVWLQP